jgi:hypothetical protein
MRFALGWTFVLYHQVPARRDQGANQVYESGLESNFPPAKPLTVRKFDVGIDSYLKPGHYAPASATDNSAHQRRVRRLPILVAYC